MAVDLYFFLIRIGTVQEHTCSCAVCVVGSLRCWISKYQRTDVAWFSQVLVFAEA